MLTGAAALLFRKGSRPHRVAGAVFVLSMLIMAASASILAVLKPQLGLVVGGLMTIYFIATAWVAGRRKDDESGGFEVVAFLAALALAIVIGMGAYALATGATKAPNPVFPYVLYGISSAMTLAALRSLLLDEERRVTMRQWLNMSRFIASIGLEDACRAVLGRDRGAQIYDAIRLANGPENDDEGAMVRAKGSAGN